MAFQVKTTTGNGYRCGCCHDSWDNEEWIAERADALAAVPTTLRRDETRGDWEIESVSVIDGETGEEIAHGRLETLSFQRGDAYRNWRWVGAIDGVPFEQRSTEVADETWANAEERLRKRRADADLAKAEAELARAQKAVDAARTSLPKEK